MQAIPFEWVALALAVVLGLALLSVAGVGLLAVLFLRSIRKEGESQRAYTERLVAIASSERAAARYPIRSPAGEAPGEPPPPKVMTEEQVACQEMEDSGLDPNSMEDRLEWIEQNLQA